MPQKEGVQYKKAEICFQNAYSQQSAKVNGDQLRISVDYHNCLEFASCH